MVEYTPEITVKVRCVACGVPGDLEQNIQPPFEHVIIPGRWIEIEPGYVLGWHMRPCGHYVDATLWTLCMASGLAWFARPDQAQSEIVAVMKYVKEEP